MTRLLRRIRWPRSAREPKHYGTRRRRPPLWIDAAGWYGAELERGE